MTQLKLVLEQDDMPAHKAKLTWDWLNEHCLIDFTDKDSWLPNRNDYKLVN